MSQSADLTRYCSCEEEAARKRSIERSVFSGHGGFRETSTLGTLALDMSSSMERSIFLATVGFVFVQLFSQ